MGRQHPMLTMSLRTAPTTLRARAMNASHTTSVTIGPPPQMASALDFWTYAAWTPTSSPLPLLQFSKEGCFDPPGCNKGAPFLKCLTWDFWHSLAHLLNPLVEAPKVALLKHCIGLTRSKSLCYFQNL